MSKSPAVRVRVNDSVRVLLHRKKSNCTLGTVQVQSVMSVGLAFLHEHLTDQNTDDACAGLRRQADFVSTVR